MSLSGRTGLHSTAVTGDTFDEHSYNQLGGCLRGLSEVLLQRLGGEGILDGGAKVIGDLATAGTLYPPVILAMTDDSGEAWWFHTLADADITFADTDAATGALYAIIQQQTAVTPVAARGGRTQVVFYAQDNGTAAPAHSLKLGTGTIVSSAFTTWTETAAIRHESWNIGAGDDADLYLYANNGDANLPGIRYYAAGNVWQSSNDGTTWLELGLGLQTVAHVGAPAIAGYAVGDRIRDELGAIFRCISISGDGAWCQETPGVVNTGTAVFPTDADVVSGGRLGDTRSRAYRIRIENAADDYQRWAFEWTWPAPEKLIHPRWESLPPDCRISRHRGQRHGEEARSAA